MAIEIERKWLVGEHADVPSEVASVEQLRQGYIALDPDTDTSVRLRFGRSGAVLAVKAGGGGLARTEIEIGVDATTAEELWEVTTGRRIDKERSRIPVGRYTAELDVYAGALTGLRTVEVEFGSESEAGAFVAPAWFGREVTVEAGWSNAALAVNGRPDR